MIRHILKIVWNERKSNILIFLEFVVVFCIFWFCCDYLYYIASRYYEPRGHDIEHTYAINMERNDEIEENPDDRYSNALLLKERLKNYPGVETVSFSGAAIPYGGSTVDSRFVINDDSAHYNVLSREVTPEYFEVYRMNIEQGRIFNEADIAEGKKVAIISGDRYGFFRDQNNTGIPVQEVKELKHSKNSTAGLMVVGVIGKQKRSVFKPYENIVYEPLSRVNYSCQSEIIIRVHPDADIDFQEKFTSDMKNHLTIGPYTFSSVSSLEDIRDNSIEFAIGNNLKSTLSISAFLMINIFLGIIGTFWSRNESRRSEIGLRIALGSSKRKVRSQMLGETMVLLFLASIIGLYICINLGESDLLQTLGIPLADYDQAGFGSGHYILNYLTTLLFLAIISGLAVWYPARQSSNVPPADALRDE